MTHVKMECVLLIHAVVIYFAQYSEVKISQRGACTHPQVHFRRVKFDGIERTFFCTGLPCYPCCYGSSSACRYFSL